MVAAKALQEQKELFAATLPYEYGFGHPPRRLETKEPAASGWSDARERGLAISRRR